MDGIKKKMIAMKLEKENAMERAIQCESLLKGKEEEKEKKETDIGEVNNKLKQAQTECDEVQESLQEAMNKMEETDKRATIAEAEVAAMTRRIRLLEEDLEVSSSRLTETTAKLEEASTIAEESERVWRENMNRLNTSDDSVCQLEKTAEEAIFAAEEAERKYKEVSRNLVMAEENLHATENRVTQTDARIQKMEGDLKTIVVQLKSVEIKREQSAETEKELDTRLNMLKRHVQEAETRMLTAEADVNRRKAEVKLTKEHISLEQSGYETLRKEMDTMINEFNAI